MGDKVTKGDKARITLHREDHIGVVTSIAAEYADGSAMAYVTLDDGTKVYGHVAKGQLIKPPWHKR